MSDALVPFIHSFLVLNNDGERLLAKYYDERPVAEQKKVESFLHKKTKSVSARTEVEVMLVDQEIVVFRSGGDCKFFISGPLEENELILVSCLDAIYDSMSVLLRAQLETRTMLENLELVSLRTSLFAVRFPLLQELIQ
jgi:hypothetical protein